jgi:hypothetical protein
MQNIPKKNDAVDAKRRICITTYEYFNQTFSHRSTISKTSPMDVPTFGNLWVVCEDFSSIGPNKQFLDNTYLSFFLYLKSALSFNKDDRVEKWKLIKITLRKILELIKIRLRSQFKIRRKSA